MPQRHTGRFVSSTWSAPSSEEPSRSASSTPTRLGFSARLPTRTRWTKPSARRCRLLRRWRSPGDRLSKRPRSNGHGGSRWSATCWTVPKWRTVLVARRSTVCFLRFTTTSPRPPRGNCTRTCCPPSSRFAGRAPPSALITNYDTRVFAVLEALGLSELLSAVVIPAHVGAAKPDPAIFRYALDRVGAAPAEALHVGDEIDDDYRGAEAVGMQAVLIDRRGIRGPIGLRRIESLTELLRFTPESRPGTPRRSHPPRPPSAPRGRARARATSRRGR